MTRHQPASLAAACLLVALLCASMPGCVPPPDGPLAAARSPDLPEARTLEAWGLEALRGIQTDFFQPGRQLPAQVLPAPGSRGPRASLWTMGVVLSAAVAGARLDPAQGPWLRQVARSLERYDRPDGPVPGYNATPSGKLDRYYDDNAWLVLALLELAELPEQGHALEAARRIMAFVASGEDAALGGGIYWRERTRDRKNACSNAPAAAAALGLCRLTGERSYCDLGQRLISWLDRRLRDPADGLIWDHRKLDGRLVRTKRSYNTALYLRALMEASEDPQHLEIARKLAHTSLARWQDGRDGSLVGAAPFAHLLLENLLRMDRRLPGHPLADRLRRALLALRLQRDAAGRYPRWWGRAGEKEAGPPRLIDQAAAARAFLFAAWELGGR